MVSAATPTLLLAGVAAGTLLGGGGVAPTGWKAHAPIDTATGETPVAAWGLRQLVSTYSGPLVRIRDTDDDSEQDVGFDEDGNLDAFSVVGDAAVVRIYNQTGTDEDHLEQTTASLQPMLLASGTPGGYPAIQFDGVDDYMEGDTLGSSGSERPYMVASPSYIMGYGGGSPNEAYGTLFNIPHVYGSNPSPYQRYGITRDNMNDTFRSRIAFSNNDAFDFDTYASVSNGWMVFASATEETAIIPGIGHGLVQPRGAGTVSYTVNPTTMIINADGAGAGQLGFYFTELTVLDAPGLTRDEYRTLCEDIRIATMNERVAGSEYRLTASNNFRGDSNDAISIAEIEFATTAAGPDFSAPTDGAYASSQFSSTFSAVAALDGVISGGNCWSTEDNGDIDYYWQMRPASPDVAEEIRLTARSDSFFNLMPQDVTIEYLDEFGQWQTWGVFDLSSEGSSANQVYTLAKS